MYFTGADIHLLDVPTPDTRKIVGGVVFAKAEAVSHDCKRIYGGAGLSKKRLRGTVLEVLSRKGDGAKKSTTYIKALYKVGTNDKEKILALQSLKAVDPNPTEPVPPPPDSAPSPTAVSTQHRNDETESPAALSDSSPAAATTTMPTGGVSTNGSLSTPGTSSSTGTSSTSSSSSSRRIPVTEANGRKWFDGSMEVDINGPVPSRFWRMTCQWTGKEFFAGCDSDRDEPLLTEYDYFMACFPKTTLHQVVHRTSANLVRNKKDATSTGEILKFFGVMILITRYEFGERASLWMNRHHTKYIHPPSFGTLTGMSGQRYEDLDKYIVWSLQPETRPDSMSSEAWRWMLVQDQVANFNEHRKEYYKPSHQICVDESISRWYGQGGTWINHGLPMYVAMDRKPEDGCEIQDACDGNSGVMMRLVLVKSEKEETMAQSKLILVVVVFPPLQAP